MRKPGKADLKERDVVVLTALASLPSGWHRPMDIVWEHKHLNDRILTKLVEHGLAERKNRSKSSGRSYLYRITDEGRRMAAIGFVPTRRECSKCGEAKNLDDFLMDKRNRRGYVCKSCHAVRMKAVYHTNPLAKLEPDRLRYANTRELQLLRRRRYYLLNRDSILAKEKERARSPKAKARAKFHAALYSGRITRPNCCQRCGRKGRIEGHHHDYDKPLEVEWLCSVCHGIEHRAYKKPESRIAAILGGSDGGV